MAWIDGTSGNDNLVGTDNDDYIYGQGGNDILEGKRGADNLYGGDGNDNVKGGKGSDHVYGGDGVDVINGGDGNDYIYGGAGNDTLIGGDGKDTFYLDSLSDFDSIIDFTAGEDTVVFNNLDGSIYIPPINDPDVYLNDFAFSGGVLSYLGNPVANIGGNFTLSVDNLVLI